METTPVITSTISPSKSALWTGRVLTTLVVLFLLFNAITKVIRLPLLLSGHLRYTGMAGVVVTGCQSA
jgi:hypothetical protein